MRLLLEITRTKDKKHYFRIMDNVNECNSDISGSGWTVRNALDEFIDQLSSQAFYDEDTVIPVSREKIRIERRKIYYEL